MKLTPRRLITYIYFSICFLLLFSLPVHAYIDPSVMTYAIQAFAGIAVALGTVAGVFWRRMKKWLFSYLGISGKRKKAYESDEVLCYKDRAVNERIRKKVERENEENQKKQSTDNRLSLKYKFLNAVPLCLFLSVTFFMAIPGSLFLGNIDEFKLTFDEVFPTLLCDTLVSFLLMQLILLFVPSKTYKILTGIIFWLGIMFYVQGAFLNPAFRAFDGVPIDWSKFQTNEYLSTGLWIASFVCILFLFFKYHKASSLLSGILCIMLAAAQVISLVGLNNSTELHLISDYHVAKDGEFSFSKEKNTIVMVLDTFDSLWFEQHILSDPEIISQFNDFTYYSDCVSSAAPTLLGVPLLLTGVTYDTDKEYNAITDHNAQHDAYLSDAYSESSLFRDLKEEDYIIRLYTDLSYLYGCDYELIDNIRNEEVNYTISDRQSFYSSLLKLTMFFVAPQVLKDRYWMARNEFSDYVRLEGGKVSQFKIDDPQFYIDLNETFSVSETKPVYMFYHLFGAHGPYTMNEKSERVPENMEGQGHLAQMRGSFNIVTTMMNKMKEAGIYDNSNIIITADHGFFHLYQNAMILYKPADAHQDALQTVDTPVTFVNLYNSISEDSLDAPVHYGETLEEVPEEIRDRSHYIENRLAKEAYPSNPAFDKEGFSEFTFHGKAREWDLVDYVK